MERYTEAVDFIAREWPILVGIVGLLIALRWAFRLRARVRESAGEDDSDLDDDCPKCPGRLHPDGMFPGGSCTEKCDRCGVIRMWVIKDGEVPHPRDYTPEEWEKQGHGPKVRQQQIRGREWGSLGVSRGSGE